MPKVYSEKGYYIYESKPQASLGYFSTGRAGKVIRGKKSFSVYNGFLFQVGPDFKTLSAAKKYLKGLK